MIVIVWPHTHTHWLNCKLENRAVWRLEFQTDRETAHVWITQTQTHTHAGTHCSSLCFALFNSHSENHNAHYSTKPFAKLQTAACLPAVHNLARKKEICIDHFSHLIKSGAAVKQKRRRNSCQRENKRTKRLCNQECCCCCCCWCGSWCDWEWNWQKDKWKIKRKEKTKKEQLMKETMQ